MVSINKSFVYGIIFASITWLISFLIYVKLSGSHVYKNSEQLIKQLQVPSKGFNDLEFGLIRDEDDLKIRNDGYKLHAFNVLISNRLDYNRAIPDTRNELCKAVKYPKRLPKATIIICFYNEHFQTLIRTIHSILNRTPHTLLQEILLVNDNSDLAGLHEQIQNYVTNLKSVPVKLFKTDGRKGLIRARMYGARKSKGDVLLFLDSHVEVNQHWIEPLLMRIKTNRTNVVMPIIDIINADTFNYSSSPLVRGGFNWGLHFKWDNLPKGTLSRKEDFIKPIKSPTMAGGLFAMDRKYFEELGEYDEGMDIWGGENLEISFRIWMCGGHLELIPCSRVGHVFRQRRPYGAPNGVDTLLRNSLRVAYVWMDNYKQYYLNQTPNAKSTDFGNISARIELRKQLKCHDFDWYLKNVYPELILPTDNEARLKKKWSALEHDKYQPWHSRKRNYIDTFQIRLTNTSWCVQSEKDSKTKGSRLVLKRCLRSKKQIWYKTDKEELVLAQLLCLQSGKLSPILFKCHEMGADQQWKYKNENNSPIYNIASGQCLGVKEKADSALVVMQLCSNKDLILWDFIR